MNEPLDFKNCVRMFGGDKEVVLRLLGDFLKNFDNQSQVLSAALNEADCERIRKEAHSIKGGAAVLTANSLMAAAAFLEEAGKKGDLAGGEKGLKALNREIALLTTYFDELKKEDLP